MRLLFIPLIFFFHFATGQVVKWKKADLKVETSFRGLSVINDKVIWLGGTNGWICRSVDGGKTWTTAQVKGFEKMDFRSVYGVDKKTAVIANAGSPAYILRTQDGGKTWKEVYRNDDSAAFIDGIGFWNSKEGVIYGDPIGGRMMILLTNDGGKNWHEPADSSRPRLEKGEASFAASGTAIRCMGESRLVIATGGKVSRLWVSEDKAQTWRIVETPILQGEPSTGIFSVAYHDDRHAIIVGGDYKNDTLRKSHVFYTTDGGRHWSKPKTGTGGYRECVEYVTERIAIATGPSGTDITRDGGMNWEPLPGETGYHTIRKARHGGLIVIAGAHGKVSILKFTAH